MVVERRIAAAKFSARTSVIRFFSSGRFLGDVSGDVRNITYRDSRVGDDKGSSPWAVKIKTDSGGKGFVTGCIWEDLVLHNVRESISISMFYDKASGQISNQMQFLTRIFRFLSCANPTVRRGTRALSSRSTASPSET